MDKGSFIKLLGKYVSGKATPGEEQFIISYYNLFEGDPDVLALMSIEEKDQLKDEIYNAVLQRIAVSETHNVKIRPLYPPISFPAAACILFMVLIGSLFFARLHISTTQIDTTYVNRTFENQTIHLQDGSMILLSPKGKISYPLSFTNLSERAIHLEGEAFFDIKPLDKPFIVTAGTIRTHVLGTSFNIQALRHEKDITVTVLRGKVKVDTDKSIALGLLTKSQQVTYNTQTLKSLKRTVDTLQYVHWKSPYIVFKNASLREARQVLEKQYDVKIILDDEGLRSKRFTTTFQKSESLEQVLKSLCEFHSAVYKYDQSKGAILITRKSTK